jgi:7-carboxy-7-deazaguanine synthase
MLRIAENFMSIQGEGASVGVPAYFIRFQGCNLMCGGEGGQLMKEGKATWWCDSEKLWRNGKSYSNKKIIKHLKDNNYLDNILGGITHIVWTGGEPALEKHRNSIIEFIEYINVKYPGNSIYSEIETNGTIDAGSSFYNTYINQINCSPKLSNSGIEKSKRIIAKSIYTIKKHPNYYFKFVISSEDDINEIQQDYIIPFNIPHSAVIIMPGVDNRNDLPERTRFIFEMTKKYGYRGISRQHILAWDRVCGV